MKLLLVSDTHGYDKNLEKVLELEKPDFLCHMGDVEGSEEHIREIAKCPLAMVSGNNDFWTDLNPEVTFELQGFRIFMTHGHTYSPYYGIDKLRSAGRNRKADIILFGHTHMPCLEEGNLMLVANPGSLSFPRQPGRKPSYMVLDLEKGKVPKFEIKFL